MFRNNIIKIISVFLGLSVLTIGFLVLWLGLSLKQSNLAQADINGIPLRGWAWTDTEGWISFNCRETNSCATVNYGVGVDEGSGKLSGYAWSDNVGWINFNLNDSEVETAGILDPGCNGLCATSGCGACSCGACYNQDERKFYGWARVLSESSDNALADASWIKLDGSNFNLTAIDESQATGDPKGDEPWGDLTGWAWGGNNFSLGANSLSGIGWLSFNCNNSGAGGCARSYKVTGRPDKLGDLQIKRIEGNETYGLNINWSAGYPAYGATWYEVWRQNGRCVGIAEDCDSSLYCSDNSVCDTSQAYHKIGNDLVASSYNDETPPLGLFVTYKYVIRACNIFGCSRIYSRALQTSPIEYAHGFKATPICAAPDTQQASYVDMVWLKPYVFSLFSGSLAEYELQYCQLEANGQAKDCPEAEWKDAATNCDNLGPDKLNCREILNSASGRYQSKEFFTYRLRAVADKGTCLGGGQDGQLCATNSDCPDGSCDLFKGTWAYANDGRPFRICPVGTIYEEQRPN